MRTRVASNQNPEAETNSAQRMGTATQLIKARFVQGKLTPAVETIGVAFNRAGTHMVWYTEASCEACVIDESG